MVSDSQVEYGRRTSAIGFSVFPSPYGGRPVTRSAASWPQVFPSPYGDRSGPAQTYVLMPVPCP